MQIIDIHAHLGNILHPNGGDIIDKTIPFAKGFDPDFINRLLLYSSPKLENRMSGIPWISNLAVKAERNRNYTATLINLQHNLDKFHIIKACIMPIEPNVTSDDILATAGKDDRIIPFCSINFENKEDINIDLQNKISDGAKGLKLHPILQKTALTDDIMMDICSNLPDGFTILSHTGIAGYYDAKEAYMQRPENGAILPFYRLAKAFPKLNFIAGHAGLREIDDVISLLPKLENVYVDTSFQSPKNIKRLISAFGKTRVLFASDWPYGFYNTSIKCAIKACGGNNELLNRIMYKNAADILKI